MGAGREIARASTTFLRLLANIKCIVCSYPLDIEQTGFVSQVSCLLLLYSWGCLSRG